MSCFCPNVQLAIHVAVTFDYIVNVQTFWHRWQIIARKTKLLIVLCFTSPGWNHFCYIFCLFVFVCSMRCAFELNSQYVLMYTWLVLDSELAVREQNETTKASQQFSWIYIFFFFKYNTLGEGKKRNKRLAFLLYHLSSTNLLGTYIYIYSIQTFKKSSGLFCWRFWAIKCKTIFVVVLFL